MFQPFFLLIALVFFSIMYLYIRTYKIGLYVVLHAAGCASYGVSCLILGIYSGASLWVLPLLLLGGVAQIAGFMQENTRIRR